MKYIFVFIAISLLGACAGESTTNEEQSVATSSTDYVLTTRDTMLAETRWKLVELSGAQVAESVEPDKVKYLLLQKQGNVVGGFSGCNTFSGTYQLIGNEGLKFSQMTSTLIACEDMEMEKQFLSMLANVDRYDISGDTLFFYQAQTAPLARFQVQSSSMQ